MGRFGRIAVKSFGNPAKVKMVVTPLSFGIGRKEGIWGSGAFVPASTTSVDICYTSHH
jgi:hypothetical protein